MKAPHLGKTFTHFMLLHVIALTLEMKTFRMGNAEIIVAIFFWSLLLLYLVTLLFSACFYYQKSTRSLLIVSGISYFAWLALLIGSQGGGGYVRSWHEVTVNGYDTLYGYTMMTFNTFLAPLVLAFNMYIFEIFFKKRFQKAAQTKTEG